MRSHDQTLLHAPPAKIMALAPAANDDTRIDQSGDGARTFAVAARVARDLGRGIEIAKVRAALDVLAHMDRAPRPEPLASSTQDADGPAITILAADICAALGADQLLELHDAEGGEVWFDEWGDVVVVPEVGFSGMVRIAALVRRAGVDQRIAFEVAVTTTAEISPDQNAAVGRVS